METKNTQGTKTTLVLGGTGKTGRRVVERLAARGRPTRVGSRSVEPPFDWGTRPRGRLHYGVLSRCTSPTTRTSRYRARWRRCIRSPIWP
jgi:hypothetical protein